MTISGNFYFYVRVILSLLAIGLVPTNSAAESPIENRVKAAFIFNFIKFTEWPNVQKLPSYNICVSENASIRSELKHMHGKQVRGVPVALKHISQFRNLEDCQVVYFSKPDRKQASKALSSLQGKPVLTIGDPDEFSNYGGIIQFFTQNNRIRFQINTIPSEQSQLIISSKLLKLSRKNSSTEVAGK